MTGQELYELITAMMAERMENNAELKRILLSVQSNKASFTESSRYANIFAEMIGELMSEHVFDSAEIDIACRLLLQDRYDDLNSVLAKVQETVDKRIGIRMQAKKAPFPEERVKHILLSLTDPQADPETIARRARSATENVANSFHDDFVHTNAEIRSKAGVQAHIIRTTDGSCCEWCTRIAGKYAYGYEPKDIYRRHDNCTCTVTYQCGRKRQNVWTKESWERPEPGVGAGDPVVFTPEQAKSLQDSVLTNGAESGTIKSWDEKPMIRAIQKPIEQQHTGKGNPNAILLFDVDLSNRQALLLQQLPEYDSRITVPKDSVNMADLSALTAKTGHEFAMFTKGKERLIIRGNSTKVNINIDDAIALAAQGFRWSGHTHPGTDFLCMQPSDGDYQILDCFRQTNSVIFNSKGEFRTFER